MGRGYLGSIDSGYTTGVDITAGRHILPSDVKPLAYHLTIEPNLNTFEYHGTVSIHLAIVKDASSITLNTVDLKITSTTLSYNSAEIKSSSLEHDDEAQTTTIFFPQKITAGKNATLVQTFSGTLNQNMAGFYRSSYKDKDGSTKYIATTQMEPTDARRAFPCFDEPALKARFTITLVADKKLTCLSNMDPISEKEVKSSFDENITLKAVTFQETPLMSTYLLAFIVGDLQKIETDSFRIPVRVFATQDQDINHGKFAVELAARTLAFYEKTFDSPYPLPKMDMVAIPDFSSSAMENWGLVTYRIVDLLYDEQSNGASVKQRIAEVVQHELAHQWFGNLVTMDFWDGLWLNEGFATWMSWYSCNHFFPEWHVWHSYVSRSLQNALSLDSLRSSHPIDVPVEKAHEINQIFDDISYSKASCVLRMVSQYLGEETFMEGIRRYIKKHAYSNTVTSDLWAALSEASGKPVGDVMNVWTKNVGFPIVSVSEDSATSSIVLKQNRFLQIGDVKPEEDEVLYPVILGLRTSKGTEKSLILTEREAKFKVDDIQNFKINADQSGVYRTSYSKDRLEKFANATNRKIFSVEDKIGIIADASALTSAGYAKTSHVLSLLNGFTNESEMIIWREFLWTMGSVRSAWMFEDENTKEGLKKAVLNLVQKKTHELGWTFNPDDGHIQQQFKALLFGEAGNAGDKQVIEAAFDQFTRFSKGGEKNAIHPNLRSHVFRFVIRYGSEKEWDLLLEIARNASTSDERNTALRSLGHSTDSKLIAKSLALCLSDEVRGQDITLPLQGLAGHREGIEAIWEWMSINWDQIEKKVPPGLTLLSNIVSLGVSGFTRRSDMKKVREFFAKKNTKAYDKILAQSLEFIEGKAKWVERDGKDVSNWVKDHVKQI